jgi:DNA-binding transcriptional LysR family regulator
VGEGLSLGFLQLHYFKALAEREHLTQTAKDLMVSAPDLSTTITRLERDLGVQLFDRVGRNIRLNEYGRIYLRHVNDVFASLENAKLEISDARNTENMKLSVAISSPIIWHDAFQSFIKNNPEITISHTLVRTNVLENS